MEKMINVGKPVTGKDLIGRDKEIETIISLIQQGQSIVLIAPRRFGKTSIILEVLKRIKNTDVFSGYVDIFSTPTIPLLAEHITKEVLANKKLDSVFSKFKNNIKGLIKNIEIKSTIEDFDFILGFGNKIENETELLKESIDFIEDFPKKYKKNIIMCFDEFGELIKFNGDNLVKIFRSKLQLQKNATYIFSGSYESVMHNLFVTPKSPFLRFARIINIGNIDLNVFSEYISSKLKQNNIEITEETINAILSFTKGHPYYTQLFIQQLILFTDKKQKIDLKYVNKVKEELLYIELNYLEKSWEELISSKENIPVLLAIANNHKNIYSVIESKKANISRSISNLLSKGVIYKTNKSYFFNDPLLEFWIQKNILQK